MKRHVAIGLGLAFCHLFRVIHVHSIREAVVGIADFIGTIPATRFVAGLGA
jgi:hypothetical protein